MARARGAAVRARELVLAEAAPAGHWEGELSSSALSTAVAVFALVQVDRSRYGRLIDRGLDWLTSHVNADGGWGDTVDSPSNLSTTLLCWSALSESSGGRAHAAVLNGVEQWLCGHAGGLEPDVLARAVLKHYGDDRTFSAPILSMCALAGRLGPLPDAWALVPQLPFELAAAPHRLFKWLRLPVVSYALPALIAIGLVRHVRGGASGPFLGRVRALLTGRCLNVMSAIQPANGGFLEAPPLTGFVVMCLAGAGHGDNPVAQRGTRFLSDSVRDDGSWPIDTNLATWVTSLAVCALAVAEAPGPPIPAGRRNVLVQWYLQQQHRVEHPFTHAAPGGWSWTDLCGGVPDADDTAGALLALHHLAGPARIDLSAVEAGISWLLGVQNRDGGFPTFCRGWGKLPFDRSCPDITAHALRAFGVWHSSMPRPLQRRLVRACDRGLRYLQCAQRPGGAWLPLWFGNQHAADHANPVYGTAQVLLSLAHLSAIDWIRVPAGMVDRARTWLLGAQGPDGGWGGDSGVPPSVEETALALSALLDTETVCDSAILRGAAWLVDRFETGIAPSAVPVGLYFASLWYAERLYPLVFGAGALGRFVACGGARDGEHPPPPL